MYSAVYHVLFFFTDTATTEIYTLSLHDALPISSGLRCRCTRCASAVRRHPRARPSSDRWHCRGPATTSRTHHRPRRCRSEEHTSELQSQFHLVCRLLLEKKK